MKKMHPSVWKRTLTKLLNEDNTAKRQTVTESQNEHLTQKRAANCFAHMYQEESTLKLPRERTRHVKNEIKKAALRKHTCWRMHDWCHPEGWTQSPKPAHSVELKQITSLNTPRPKRQPFYGYIHKHETVESQCEGHSGATKTRQSTKTLSANSSWSTPRKDIKEVQISEKNNFDSCILIYCLWH